MNEIYQNPSSEIGIKYQFLEQKMNEIYQFKPQLYNLWNKQFYDADNEHFGKFPKCVNELSLGLFHKLYKSALNSNMFFGRILQKLVCWGYVN